MPSDRGHPSGRPESVDMAHRPGPVELNLLEYASEVAPRRVDRAKCVIYDVKILGKESPNTHGQPGATRTVYTLEAMQQARELYNRSMSNVGHPPRTDPGRERDPNDRVGKLLDVYVSPAGDLRGNLKLIPSHPMTSRLLDAAEDPDLHDCFALSHNARGRGQVVDGAFVISSIPKLRSVDVVSTGGTNVSLFESREPERRTAAMPQIEKITVRDLIESARDSEKTPWKSRWANLLEDEMGDMSVAPMPPPEPAAAPGGEAAGAAGGDGSPEMGHEEHLAHMLKAIVLDDALSDKEKCDKIKKALKLIDGSSGDGEGGGGEEEEEDEGGKPFPKGKKGGEEEGDGLESLEPKEKVELVRLRANEHCRDLCESLAYAPDSVDLAALTGMTNDSTRRKYIQRQKERVAPPKTRTVPRTTVPGHLRSADVQESYRDAPPVGDEKRATWYKN